MPILSKRDLINTLLASTKNFVTNYLVIYIIFHYRLKNNDTLLIYSKLFEFFH